MIELLKNVSKSGLTANQFLLCLLVQYKNEVSPGVRANLLSSISHRDYSKCIEKKVITQKVPDIFSLENLEITKKFLTFVGESPSVKRERELNEWFDEWYDLFPEKIKSGGYTIKTNPKGCKKNLSKFIKEHPKVTGEIILKATKNYIDEFALKGYSFMKLAPYFIYKDGISTLEDYCNSVIKGDDGPKPTTERTL